MSTTYNTLPISQLPLATALEASDYLPIVDVTNPSDSPLGTTSKTTLNALSDFVGSALNVSNKESCQVGTTTNLTAIYLNGAAGVGATLTNNGSLSALSIDGIALSLNARVLVKNQSTQYQNGIYIVTAIGSSTAPWVLTRSADYNNSFSNEINFGDIIAIIQGSTNSLTIWFQTQINPIAIGTTSIIFDELAIGEGNVSADGTGTTGIVPIYTTNGYTIGSSNLTYDFESHTMTMSSGQFLANAFTVNQNGGFIQWNTTGYTTYAPVIQGVNGQFIYSADTHRAQIDPTSGYFAINNGTVDIFTSGQNDLTGHFNVQTPNNMLDDGLGNASFSGTISASNFLPLKAQGSYTPSTASTSDAITISGITSSDVAVVFPTVASANAFYIRSQACTTNTLTVTYNTAPGAGGTMYYLIYGA